MSDFQRLATLPVPAAPPMFAALSALTKLALTTRELDAAGKEVASPSEAQKESGNYKKGHVSWKGLRLTIETAKGQTRSGVGKDGKKWSQVMRDHYGYVKGTESGADGDNVDVFITDDGASDDHGSVACAVHTDLRSELVHVVNQIDPGTGKFDEHKVVLGCVDAESAKAVYLRNYQKGWQGLGAITALTLDQFKWWLQNGDTAKEIKDSLFAAPANRKKKAELKTTFETYRPSIYLIKRASTDQHPFTIAVDLDGTLAEKEEPFDPEHIGDLRERASYYMDAFHEAGARLIIFTVRGNRKLVKEWLEKNKVPFDYVNENPDQPPDSSGKVFADAYWDDKAYNAEDLDEFGPLLLARARGEDEPEDNVIVRIMHTKIIIGPADEIEQFTEEGSDAEGIPEQEQDRASGAGGASQGRVGDRAAG